MSTARLATLIGSLIIAIGPAQRAEPRNAPPGDSDLAAYVERARLQFNIPGMAVAVVKDGRVVFEQGFGQRNLADGRPVDVHTMFCIASNTKPMTATALEMLADQGKLRLDDRVIDHLPWFRMSNAYVTREIRIRDILAHRSGLAPHAGDLLFVPETTYTTRDVVERLRNLPLTTGFRSGFAYENILYAVATLVIEQASGQSYANFVRERIFAPLGMTESRIDATDLKPTDAVATPYAPRQDGIGVVVLANQESDEARKAITWRVLDSYLGAPPTDWIDAYATARRQEEKELQERVADTDSDRVAGTRPSRSLENYAGTYNDSWYGVITIRLVGNELRLRFSHSPRLSGSLVPWAQDAFRVRWDDRTLDADGIIEFTIDGQGAMTGARMRRASPRTTHAYDYQDLNLVKANVLH